MTTPSSAGSTLIRALLDPALYDHPVTEIELVETHISWVLLTGPFAYKIKKPVNLGFLDFSDLGSRHFYCQEELRLNRRLAPELYLAVLPITGTPQAPRLNGKGQAFEYAIKMVQFPQAAQLDRLLAHDGLHAAHIAQLAQRVADFHQAVAVSDLDSPHGTPEAVLKPVAENFSQIHQHAATRAVSQLEALRQWSESTFESLSLALVERKQHGFVRECHGDLHLGNIALLHEKIVIFDCLEFNPLLRWIDVMSDTAFLVMDLEHRDRPDLARLCLNDYLLATGDYSGLRVLRFYQTYRALVRAKVAAIRASQKTLSTPERQHTLLEFHRYLDLAQTYTQTRSPALIITHGFSGAGKTFVAKRLTEVCDAILLRSDVERKRLHGLAALQTSGSGLDTGLYTPAADDLTYQRLAELAHTIIEAGFPVIVDATFLKHHRRQLFAQLAEALAVPFVILHVRASEEVMRQRITARQAGRADASEADLQVFDRQHKSRESFTDPERARLLTVDNTELPAAAELLAALTPLWPTP